VQKISIIVIGKLLLVTSKLSQISPPISYKIALTEIEEQKVIASCNGDGELRLHWKTLYNRW